jgi:hypothetical protein
MSRTLLKMPPRERKKAVNERVEQGELPRAKKGEGQRRRPRELAHSLVGLKVVEEEIEGWC